MHNEYNNENEEENFSYIDSALSILINIMEIMEKLLKY